MARIAPRRFSLVWKDFGLDRWSLISISGGMVCDDVRRDFNTEGTGAAEEEL